MFLPERLRVWHAGALEDFLESFVPPPPATASSPPGPARFGAELISSLEQLKELNLRQAATLAEYAEGRPVEDDAAAASCAEAEQRAAVQAELLRLLQVRAPT